MKMTPTLGRYLAKSYFSNLLVLLFALLAVIYLFDTVELLRRGSKFDDVSLGLILQMGLLKLPEVGQVLFPFAILFSAMFTFWQLTRRYELIVVRASGFSVWQFLTPVLTVAVFVALLQVTAINPVGSLLIGKFDQLESKYLKRQDSQIALFKEGLWLRQGFAQTTSDASDGYVILHARQISQPDWTLNDVTVLFFKNDNTFVRRIDSESAHLDQAQWVFDDVTMYEPGKDRIKRSSYMLPTQLTIADVEESFSSPESMSFWRLPGHIQTLEETGFDASRLRVHYHNLLSQPLMFAAMILLAAAVSMRPPRFNGGMALIGIGVFLGFFVFFMSSFLQALGASQQIPIVLAAWAPAMICFLLGLTVMMNLEDG
ncbi:MAG: LPS export ABC transporter permease LptG [Alphaproteobacteria bacterium]|nr:LPS export ABC transporter permease LptG [Alphaproteobacteria bacterium]